MILIHPALAMAFLLAYVSLADPPPPPPCAPGPTCGEFYPPGHQDMGNSWWSIGDQRFNVTLSQVTTFLQLPQPPQNSSGVIALDPALDNSDPMDPNAPPASFAFETLAAVFPMDACNQNASEWCLFLSTWTSNATSAECQDAQKPGDPFAQGATIKIEYMINPHFVLQSFDAGGGHMQNYEYQPQDAFQFWPRTECLCESQGTIPQHTYSQTSIVLSEPVPDFNTSVHQSNTNDPLVYTSDGGLTWHVDTLTLDASSCDNQNPCTGNQVCLNPPNVAGPIRA